MGLLVYCDKWLSDIFQQSQDYSHTTMCINTASV